MRFLLIVLTALISVASASPITRATQAFPGDAFLRALASNSTPRFATKVPLAPSSMKTRQQLSLFRSAALSLNLTNPVNFLDKSRDYPYPEFGRCELDKDDNEVIPFATATTLGSYFEDIFKSIPKLTKGMIKLSRFDLFHGHLFANPALKTAGVVFHSQEYPAVNENTFPYNLGFCQADSNLAFVDKVMRKRNLVWTIDASDRTSLWWIDMSAKTGNSAVDKILNDGPFYTLYEGDLGHVVADYLYLEGLELGLSLY